MTSKKYSLLLALIVLVQTVSMAQTTDWGWNWKDSSKIATEHIPQYNEFLNNQFPYPPQPRNQWELGLSTGLAQVVSGEAGSHFGIGGGISLRKALNNTFSARVGYIGAFNTLGNTNFKSMSHMGTADFIVSLNSASHYRGNPKTNVYLLAGYSLIATQVMTQDFNGAPTPGVYHVFYGNGIVNSQNGLISTVAGTVTNGRHGWSVLSGASFGGGFAFKVSNKVNLGIEERLTFTIPGYDLLDGVKGGNSDDHFSYTSLKLNINLGNPARKVQPLWWLNPYNFIYSELNRPTHMKMPPVVLPDADGDGVTDQFDLEPNTPKGAPVDSHGVSKDTDGDGVPDYRDKEILTPLKCFPVDKDGVGTCPEPACCKELREMIKNLPAPQPPAPTCAIGNLPSVQFKNNAKLSKDAEKVLASAAAQISANPNCHVRLIGYASASKAAQQMSYDRVNAVKRFLVDKQGIAENRIIFVYGKDGDSNTVDLQGTMDDGPNTVPAPNPNMRKG